MNFDMLIQELETLTESPGGVNSFRTLVCNLAVSGRLVEPNDFEPNAIESVPRRLKDSFSHSELVNWLQIPLAECVEIYNGNSTSDTEKNRLSKVSDGRPLVATKDVGYGFQPISLETGLKVPFVDTQYKIAPANAVLICLEGGSAGKKMGILGQEVCFGNKLFANVCKPWIDSKYLLICLLSTGFSSQFQMQLSGIIGGISKAKYGEIRISLPPLSEQKRIVSKVDELMALCDQLEERKNQRDNLRTAARESAINAISTATTPEELETAWKRINNNWEVVADTPESLDSLRELILDLAVRGDLGITDVSATKAPTLWDVEEQKLDVDKLWKLDTMHVNPANGWSRLPLARLGTWGSGGTPTASRKEFYNNGSIPWAVIGDLNNGIMTDTTSKITEKALASSSAKLIPKNAVLIAMYGASIGKTAVTGIECTTNQAIAHCIVDESVVSTEYFFLVAKSLKKHLIKVGKGAAQPNISQTVLKHLLIDVPQLNAQQIVVSKVNELMALCDQLEESLTLRGQMAEKFTRSVTHAA